MLSSPEQLMQLELISALLILKLELESSDFGYFFFFFYFFFILTFDNSGSFLIFLSIFNDFSNYKLSVDVFSLLILSVFFFYFLFSIDYDSFNSLLISS